MAFYSQVFCVVNSIQVDEEGEHREEVINLLLNPTNIGG